MADLILSMLRLHLDAFCLLEAEVLMLKITRPADTIGSDLTALQKQSDLGMHCLLRHSYRVQHNKN